MSLTKLPQLESGLHKHPNNGYTDAWHRLVAARAQHANAAAAFLSATHIDNTSRHCIRNLYLRVNKSINSVLRDPENIGISL